MTSQLTIDPPNSQFITCNTLNSTDTHRVAYRKYGDPTKMMQIIFCVHGLLGNNMTFHYLSDYLAQNGFVSINIDLIGRGDSDHLQSDKYSFKQYINDVITIVNTIYEENKKNHKFYYIGTSLGGLIGMSLPLFLNENKTYPQIQTFCPEFHGFNAMMLNDIGPFVSTKIDKLVPPIKSWKTLEDVANFLMQVSQKNFGPRSDYTFFYHRAKYGFKWDNATEGYIANYDRNGVIHELEDRSFTPKIYDKDQSDEGWSYWEGFNKITWPLLIYHGEKSELLSSITLQEMVTKYTENNDGGNIEYINWPDTGHVPPLYTPEEMTPVLAFFNKY